MSTSATNNNQLGVLNLIVFVLSIYVLLALLIDTLIKLPQETSTLLSYIDNVICVFFFVEFCIRFYHAENKLRFMRWGWIDLVSSIPAVSYLRAGRILRLIRLLRLIRAFKSTQQFLRHVFKSKAQGAFTSVAILAILIIIFSSIAILQVEKDPSSNIKSAEDAIWWSYVTITTVGYGDKFPVTTEGRIIAVFLMTAGVGLFGTFTAFVASWFVEDKSQHQQANVVEQ
ncbi:potassium channel family protein [Mucilaginibacter sp. ZT4R22]|uniref:Potassium channel family protein n=1 Tax=Mucilaginibacter pankratovii TaxID=2772110 RepID=A0ABR7WW23_9SPHI|nr:potassium channel family protein [Mucilaginibacter pankratovii]MBD1366488.1 potassium channel family protein [Mucilaginibacter pankratovii]